MSNRNCRKNGNFYTFKIIFDDDFFSGITYPSRNHNISNCFLSLSYSSSYDNTFTSSKPVGFYYDRSTCWYIFAGYALVVAILFFILFKAPAKDAPKLV